MKKIYFSFDTIFLPAEDANLLGLPKGNGIEFIDLPGLKSIQDRDNLKVIQQQVNKAFSFVALDYLVDDRHRKRLLEELKKDVQYLQGRTDSIIFILNRVARESQDDIAIAPVPRFAIAKKIEKLQSEIKATLDLDELPDIILLKEEMQSHLVADTKSDILLPTSYLLLTTSEQIANMY